MTALRQRMLEDMKIRNLALNTQGSYLLQVSQFARHFGKSPELLGPEDIRAYQLYLTQEKKLAPGSIIIAVSALRFLYKVTLRREWKLEDIIPAPKAPQKLPIIRELPARMRKRKFSLLTRGRGRESAASAELPLERLRARYEHPQ